MIETRRDNLIYALLSTVTGSETSSLGSVEAGSGDGGASRFSGSGSGSGSGARFGSGLAGSGALLPTSIASPLSKPLA